MQDILNDRKDEFGGASIENRLRFPLMVVKAVVEAVGADRTGIRFSPWGTSQEMGDSDPIGHWTYICECLKPFNLAYVHFVKQEEGSLLSLKSFKQAFAASNTRVLAAGGGGHSFNNIEAETVDAVVFGRLFISNPDLPLRLAKSIPLTKYVRETIHNEGEEGYTTYPEASASF